MTTPRRGHGGHAGGSAGPYLVVVAFWQETADVDAIANALRSEVFPRPEGYEHGAGVTFARAVATEAGFRRTLGLFDLSDVFQGVDPR